MRSVNFVVLGEQTIANDFGKKGTVTDLTVYDRKESDIIRTWVVPNGFPEKIQPLLQAINIAEYVIFYVASLDSCLLYTSPSPRDRSLSRMPSSA